MRCTYRWSVGLLVALGLVARLPDLSAAATAQTVDNPMYQWWAAWREGASITLKSETVLDGKSLGSQTITQTLKKLSAEKAVVEILTEVTMGGQTIKAPPQSVEFLAKLPRIDPKNLPKTDPKDKGPEPKVTKGRETLTVSGKKLACEWTQSELGGTVTKAWHCDDVPGRLVKSVATDSASKLTATTQLIEWKGTKR